MPPDLALSSTLTGSNYPSRTNFHGPKGVRAIEVQLYSHKQTTVMIRLSIKDFLTCHSQRALYYLTIMVIFHLYNDFKYLNQSYKILLCDLFFSSLKQPLKSRSILSHESTFMDFVWKGKAPSYNCINMV